MKHFTKYNVTIFLVTVLEYVDVITDVIQKANCSSFQQDLYIPNPTLQAHFQESSSSFPRVGVINVWTKIWINNGLVTSS